MTTIDHDALFQIFERLDDAFASKQTICVIEAAAVLCAGHRERQTQDIDDWRHASVINDRDLAQVAKSAGIGLNPTEIDVHRVYLQTISPGVVQLPRYDGQQWATGSASEVSWRQQPEVVMTACGHYCPERLDCAQGGRKAVSLRFSKADVAPRCLAGR